MKSVPLAEVSSISLKKIRSLLGFSQWPLRVVSWGCVVPLSCKPSLVGCHFETTICSSTLAGAIGQVGPSDILYNGLIIAEASTSQTTR